MKASPMTHTVGKETPPGGLGSDEVAETTKGCCHRGVAQGERLARGTVAGLLMLPGRNSAKDVPH